MAKILIIDDDPASCRMLAEILHSQQHQADSVATLAAGLTQAKNSFFLPPPFSSRIKRLIK
jgi:DNA-binding response OmpR family regulator